MSSSPDVPPPARHTGLTRFSSLPLLLPPRSPVSRGTGMAPIVRDDFFGKAKAPVQYAFPYFWLPPPPRHPLTLPEPFALLSLMGGTWGQQGRGFWVGCGAPSRRGEWAPDPLGTGPRWTWGGWASASLSLVSSEGLRPGPAVSHLKGRQAPLGMGSWGRKQQGTQAGHTVWGHLVPRPR